MDDFMKGFLSGVCVAAVVYAVAWEIQFRAICRRNDARYERFHAQMDRLRDAANVGMLRAMASACCSWCSHQVAALADELERGSVQ